MNWLKRLFHFRLTEIDFAAIWALSLRMTKDRRRADHAEAEARQLYLEKRR